MILLLMVLCQCNINNDPYQQCLLFQISASLVVVVVVVVYEMPKNSMQHRM